MNEPPVSGRTPEPPVSSRTPEPPVSDAYRRYALGLLLVVYVFNFIDRQILSILAEAIRLDLGLSDAALGFLGGIAFALFYTAAGIPIARWSDRGVRRSIIALGLFTWSAMTAVTGLARNFLELVLARIGVGLGEAACSPPAHSLLSDYFPPERRGTAFAVYSLGIPIGSAIGILTGGWIKELFDWRTAFFVVGVPGVLLAGVVRLTLREPLRGRYDPPPPAGSGAPTESVADVLRYMAARRTLRHLGLGAALHAFYGYGATFFAAAFLIRSHGYSEGELSVYLAAIAFFAAGSGTFLGGWLSDRLARRDVRWYVWLPALATVAAVPFAAGFYLAPDGATALWCAAPVSFFGGMYLGPTFAMAQGLAKPHMRALVSAVLLFVINLIGLGLGPQSVGLLSDALRPAYGADSLRHALLWVVVAGACWSALHYALAGRWLRADLAASGAAAGQTGK